MKEYTKLRIFYSWVGFSVIWAIVILLIGFLIVYFFYPIQKTEAFSPAKIEVAAIVTAYTSSEDETDSTPLINAAGTRPQDGSIACPSKYPFGTLVMIQGKEYRCDDRMARDLQDQPQFDIWVTSKKEAFEFGRQLVIATVQL
jgi:3D (Asp-Asp-Asp) domain-containing protein